MKRYPAIVLYVTIFLLSSLYIFLPIACKRIDRDYLTQVNMGLTFRSVPYDRARVNIPYSYDADATGLPGATIRYSLALSPTGMTIDATTGEVSWTPDATHLGLHPVEVLAGPPPARPLPRRTR